MADDDLAETIRRCTQLQAEADAAVIERAVEEALQGGRSGVLVTRHAGWVEAFVDSSVPYGWIHERTA
jgi:hypothetical protein